jgi:hypothetical protein
MKNHLITPRASLWAALLIGVGTTLSQAAPKPPPSPAGTNGVFTWDCLSSGGGQPGIAFLTFSNDYTFSGDLVVAGSPTVSKNPRGASVTGRGDSTASTVAESTNNFFGYWGVEGPWGYDIKGRVIGSFIQIVKIAPEVTINWNTITVTTPDYPSDVYDYGTGLITQTQTVAFFVDSGDGAQGYPATTDFVRTFVGPSSTRTYNWTAINMNDGYTNSYTTNLTFFNATNLVSPATTNFTFTFAAADLTTNIAWSVTGPNGYVTKYSQLFTASNSLGYTMSGVETNQISFVGTVTPNKRITLLASTSLGGNKLTYTGVPMNTNKLTNISGNWTGTKVENNVNYTEFFAVTPSSLPYLFFADGTGAFPSGPGYDVNGVVMVSSQKKIAFAQHEHPWGSTNYTLRAATGPLSVSKTAITAKTKGLDETGSALNFNATLALP